MGGLVLMKEDAGRAEPPMVELYETIEGAGRSKPLHHSSNRADHEAITTTNATGRGRGWSRPFNIASPGLPPRLPEN